MLLARVIQKHKTEFNLRNTNLLVSGMLCLMRFGNACLNEVKDLTAVTFWMLFIRVNVCYGT